MPVEIKYIDDGEGLEAIGRGVVTGDELFKANNKIYSGEILRKQKYQLVDLANVEKLIITNEEIVKIAGQDIEASKTNPRVVIAIVAKDDLTFGLARLWEGHVSECQLETMIFREMEEARQWINKRIGARKYSATE